MNFCLMFIKVSEEMKATLSWNILEERVVTMSEKNEGACECCKKIQFQILEELLADFKGN